MQVGRIVCGLIAVGYLATFVGCPGPVTNPISTPIPTAPSQPKQAPVQSEQPITSADKAELLSGTGSVDEDAPQEFTETKSGIKYRILRKSDGKKPTASDSVTVNYRGWLDDGTEFDSSYQRGEPTSFPLSNVIPGWTEGMQLVREGGMIELWIPARLGYGSRGAGDAVPPNATLHFIVELIEVK